MKFSKLTPWQRNNLLLYFIAVVLVFGSFLATVVYHNTKSINDQRDFWQKNLSRSERYTDSMELDSKTAIRVNVGTHVETIKEMNLRSSYFQVITEIWFRWEGNKNLDMKNNFRVHGGKIMEKYIVKEVLTDSVCYQLLRCDIWVSESFWTTRFPLESHQLRMSIICDYPADKVLFVSDKKSSMEDDVFINGYEIVKHTTGVSMRDVNYTETSHASPDDKIHLSEFFTFLRINRSSWGLYVKCFIALFGTTIWVLIVLYLSVFHKMDPVGMIPAALFGTVANVMVGANLLPDALSMGLLEYVNIFGVMTIITVTLTVLRINTIRNRKDDHQYAQYFGMIMVCTVVTMVILGHIIMPLSAYLFHP